MEVKVRKGERVRIHIRPDLSDFDIRKQNTKLHWPVQVALSAARPDVVPVRRLSLKAGSKQPLERRAENYREGSLAVEECPARVCLFDTKWASRESAAIREHKIPVTASQS